MITKSTTCLLLCLLQASIASYLDEMQIIQNECLGEDMFQCRDGGCINREQQCDQVLNCNDGSDENFCVEHAPDARMCIKTGQFLCMDTRSCIPRAWLCDNRTDCRDGSDEGNCSALVPSKHASCKGFECGDGKCISRYQVCNIASNCPDKSDELPENCRYAVGSMVILSDFYYEKKLPYFCLDKSRIIPTDQVCDELKDCDDGSDEGELCKTWKPQCSNVTCPKNAECAESKNGPKCYCYDFENREYYPQNQRPNKTCDFFDICKIDRPVCSQLCDMASAGMYYCSCVDGYKLDKYKIGHRCYVQGPEAQLFFTTEKEINYIKVRSREIVAVASGLKQAHGVSYDGNFLYWVEIEQGHQCIVKAKINDIEATKQVIVSIGIEDVGDIAVDWLGNNIYFSDSQKGTINVCRNDGSVCIVLKTPTRIPKHVTLDPNYGDMYWGDWKEGPVIMGAKMDGSEPRVVASKLQGAAAGVAVDSLSRRLYYSDKTIKGVNLHNGSPFHLFYDPIYHPYALVVFENSVYWSDWNSNSVMESDKIYEHMLKGRKYEPYKLNSTVYGLHMYHPILYNRTVNPCDNHKCSHLCLVTSNVTSVCACPEGMTLNGTECQPQPNYEPLYLIVGGGPVLTRIQYEAVGNPETHATHFNIGRVQTMAYDNTRDTLYIYDGQRKTINFVNMSDFNLGHSEILVDQGLGNVVDMAYDYVADSLYFLDAGRGFLEVISLNNSKRAIVMRFRDKIPISMCLFSDNGFFLIAVEDSRKGSISIESYGLDGSEMMHILSNDLKGPHIQLRFEPIQELVFIADDGDKAIDTILPEGIGRSNFRELSTSIKGLAVIDNHVFWTDKSNDKVYWANPRDYSPTIRRYEFTIFPNETYLHLLLTIPPPSPDNPLLSHPCRLKSCSDVCVQTRHLHKDPTGFKCLCPPGLLNLNGLSCTEIKLCKEDEGYCHISNTCFKHEKRCDGVKDCIHGEDEEDCTTPKHSTSSTTTTTPAPLFCSDSQYLCNNVCISKNTTCYVQTTPETCISTEFQCMEDKICIPRWGMCNGQIDCVDGSDEFSSVCHTHNCLSTEFMCVTTGSCILSSFRCDNEPDCPDGSDEVDCDNTHCVHGYYRCNNGECIELVKRCDANNDCEDGSDELFCEEDGATGFDEEVENCPEWEYTCELDRSKCIPLTFRCDGKYDCTNGTDEIGCLSHRCNNNAWKCNGRCVHPQIICDHIPDCEDGSDESAEACRQVNKTVKHVPIYPGKECQEGFLCNNGQCIEWKEVCDSSPNCFDGSDENGLCLTSCEINPCSHQCHATPAGPVCACPDGYSLDVDKRTCVDIDECDRGVCSQSCYNLPGSYVCSCHYGYALRADRHTCKATSGNLAILYVSGNTVKSKTIDGNTKVEYNNPKISSITDMDVDVRRKKLYVTSADAGLLIEVNETHQDVAISNVGRPTMVSVDWITGNVYFVDDQKSEQSFIRACNFEKKRCAKVHFLPWNSTVTAFLVDPATRRLFYCLTIDHESMVYTASMTGLYSTRLTTVHNCTGLAVDSFTKKLYVGETGPAQLLQMNYEGEMHKKIITNDRHFEAPHGLVIFEDHIYFLVANSFELNRCALYGKRECEPYLKRVFDANTFVIRHKSVQRNDLANHCVGFNCSNVCVVGVRGPNCICTEGQGAWNGECERLKRKLLPSFNGVILEESLESATNTITEYVVVSVFFTFAFIAIGLVIYYMGRTRLTVGPYVNVRYWTHRRSESGESASSRDLPPPMVPAADIELPAEPPGSGGHHEFTNPLEYLKSAWRQSCKRRRPINQPAIHIAIPMPRPSVDTIQTDSTSDTESDIDIKEAAGMFPKESDA